MDFVKIESSKYSYFKGIKNHLSKRIDILKLPIVGEGKYIKPTGDKFGHIFIKLEVETDERLLQNRLSGNIYSYSWDLDEDILPREYEEYVFPQIECFANLLSCLNDNEVPLRFRVINGSYKETETPSSFSFATVFALDDICKKL